MKNLRDPIYHCMFCQFETDRIFDNKPTQAGQAVKYQVWNNIACEDFGFSIMGTIKSPIHNAIRNNTR